MGDNLGIVDFRNIVKSLLNNYDVDFSNFALTSLKRRFEKVMSVNGLKSPEGLIAKIEKDPGFVDIFLHQISVAETEMFRDPSMWRELRDKVLPQIGESENVSVWMPCVTSGEELFTFMIILKEAGFLGKVKVVATSVSNKNIEALKKGIFDERRFENYEANFQRYHADADLKEYYSQVGTKIIMDSGLLKDVEFRKHNVFKDEPPKRIRLVIYRNKLIYFNQILQNQALLQINNSLQTGGFLVLGIKEMFDAAATGSRYSLFVKNESIYKKLGG